MGRRLHLFAHQLEHMSEHAQKFPPISIQSMLPEKEKPRTTMETQTEPVAVMETTIVDEISTMKDRIEKQRSELEEAERLRNERKSFKITFLDEEDEDEIVEGDALSEDEAPFVESDNDDDLDLAASPQSIPRDLRGDADPSLSIFSSSSPATAEEIAQEDRRENSVSSSRMRNDIPANKSSRSSLATAKKSSSGSRKGMLLEENAEIDECLIQDEADGSRKVYMNDFSGGSSMSHHTKLKRNNSSTMSSSKRNILEASLPPLPDLLIEDDETAESLFGVVHVSEFNEFIL